MLVRLQEMQNCRKLNDEMLVWSSGCIEVHIIVQLMTLPPSHLLLHQHSECYTFLVPAYLGCP